MKKLALIVPALLLASCGEEPVPEADTSETGGEVSGEVLGGTISDDMLPLEELTSTSPPAERQATTRVTTTSDGEETTVETTVTTTTDPEAPAPAPPEPPATPEEGA